MERKIERMIFVFRRIAYESGDANSQDTCHRQSMCDQAPLRFSISLREIFSKSVPFRLMENYSKSARIQISQMFETL